MNVQWDDLKTVMHLVRGGSLAAAALALDVNYTTVARRIARAESALNTALFERLADGYKPTEAGLAVARHASEMEVHEHGLIRDLAGRDERFSGQLVISAPQLLIGPHLSEVIEQYCATHPDVELSLRASNDLVDLSRREADLAIRISNSPGDSLKGVRLAKQHSASFASQKWADRILANRNTMVEWVTYDQLGDVPKFVSKNWPNHRTKLRCNDMVAMIGAAQAGVGVVRMPMFLGRSTPGLVQVPVLPPQPYPDIWVVAHPDVWPSARVAAFRERLVPYFCANRAQFVA